MANEGPQDAEGPVVRWGRTGWNVLGVALAIYVAALVVGRLRLVLVPILVAILLSTQLVGIARALERRGWPRLASAWVAFGTMAGVVAAIALLVVPGVASEVGNLSDTLGSSGSRIQDWLVTGPLHLSRSSVSDFSSSLGQQVTGNQDRLIHGALATAPIVLEVLASVLLTVVLTFFFVKDGEIVVDRLVGMLRPHRRPGVRRFLDDALRILTGYVRGSAVNGVVNAAVLSIALWILGIPLIIPIAVLTVVGSFIPLVGAIVSGGVAAAVALVESGPTAALVVIGVTVLIHHLEAYVVGPLVMGRSVHLHPVAVIVSIAAGTIAFGILGAFTAVPVVAIASAAIDAANERADLDDAHPPSAAPITTTEVDRARADGGA